jgi:hypothetical protein
MERKTAGLLGALAGLTAMGGGTALAATDTTLPPEPLQITSYSDLLRPIPNAVELLKAHNAAFQEQARSAPPVAEGAPLTQVHDNYYHHHHHHYYHHHHHHHHHHHDGGVIVVPLPGVGIRVN